MYRVEITFGVGFNKFGQPVGDIDGKIGDALLLASKLFGGATLIEGLGSWVNGKGELVREGSRTLRIDFLDAVSLVSAKHLANVIKDKFCQESVVFSFSDVNSEFV